MHIRPSAKMEHSQILQSAPRCLSLKFPGLQDSKEKFKFGGCIFAKLLYPQIARVGNAFSRRMRNPIKTSPLRRVRGLGLGRGEDLNIERLPFAQSPASFVTKYHNFFFEEVEVEILLWSRFEADAERA